MFEQFAVNAADFDGPVLVTGAGGCIGSWALALLHRAGVPVVAFDLSENKRRPLLLMTAEEMDAIPWLTGNIADTDRVAEVVKTNDIRAIIHLAALQVPFCVADPVGGALANVVGTTNILEAARHNDIKRVGYASSIAAHGALPGSTFRATLYGAYKYCNENTGKVYWEDWQVPSVGMRPGVVYGTGRDQGITSKTTVAILAAAAGVAYDVPFSGAVSALYAGEVASAFIQAVSTPRTGAAVHDLNGRVTTVERWLEVLEGLAPGNQVGIDGNPLPFPADLDDAPLRAEIGDYGFISIEDGIRETFDLFKDKLASGQLEASNLD